MFRTFDIAARRAELTPEKTALHEIETGERVSYRELDRRACAFAHSLPALGIQRGDRIAILSHNCAAFFEILFGCAKAGVVLVPLDWRLNAEQLTPLLADCSARLLLHDAACAELADSLRGTLPLVAIGSAAEPMADGSYQALLAQAQSKAAFPAERAAGGLWYMLYTAGTDGQPKAVLQTFGMAWANYINLAQAMDLTSQEVTANYLPLFHTAGINLPSLPTLIAGGTVVILPGFDAERLLGLIDDAVLTAFFAVPAVYQMLSEHPRFGEVDLAGVRIWSAIGAPLPEQLIHGFAERGALVCQGYGMTETGPSVFFMDKAHVLDKPTSVGKPQILSQVRIVDDQGTEVGPGQPGELLVLGPNVSPGYWNRPAAAADAYDERGWLRTGDIAMRDADGYYYIVDRIKDVYVSEGRSVFPADIERVLASHPDVLEAAVVGLPDDDCGSTGHAFVIPRPGRAVRGSELLAFCREHLAGHQHLREVRVLDDFPRCVAGRVLKRQLREQCATGV